MGKAEVDVSSVGMGRNGIWGSPQTDPSAEKGKRRLHLLLSAMPDSIYLVEELLLGLPRSDDPVVLAFDPDPNRGLSQSNPGMEVRLCKSCIVALGANGNTGHFVANRLTE